MVLHSQRHFHTQTRVHEDTIKASQTHSQVHARTLHTQTHGDTHKQALSKTHTFTDSVTHSHRHTHGNILANTLIHKYAVAGYTDTPSRHGTLAEAAETETHTHEREPSLTRSNFLGHQHSHLRGDGAVPPILELEEDNY